jgi:hypothetical protein
VEWLNRVRWLVIRANRHRDIRMVKDPRRMRGLGRKVVQVRGESSPVGINDGIQRSRSTQSDHGKAERDESLEMHGN